MKFHLSFLLASLLLALPVQSAVLISPTDKGLQYSGRIGDSKPGEPLLSWPGTSITARFTGTSVAVILADRQGANWYSVFVDDDFDNPVVLQLEKGEHTYPVASGLEPGTHSLLIYKRTEGWEGGTRFKGLELDDGASLQAPPPRPERRIEFYGDSITSGMSVDAGFYAGDREAGDKNSFNSYAAITARELGAEFHSISLSGIGLMVSGFNFIMPVYYKQRQGIGQNSSRWDFSAFKPQAVVINLGQNDSWNLSKLQTRPGEQEIVQAYYDFMVQIREHHGDALIIMVLGSMDASAGESLWPGYMERAVARFRQERNDDRVATLIFPFTGYRKHPRAEQQAENAALLTQLLRQELDW